jgi:carbon-monoxide dehydrogenase medium subunit
VLAEHGSEAKVLAGGQSLVPVLAMRLAEPAHLVDINKVSELDTVTTSPAGVTVGALARHSRVERDEAAGRVQPLLRQALRLVAHPTIRNRGTTVGSLAHADPAGEMTAVLALCGGSVTAVSSRGRRVITAADFFLGPLESALEADELAVEAFFPALPSNAGTAFVEIARRHGDYALCGVAAVAVLDPAGGLASLRCAYLSVFDVPLVLELTQSWRTNETDAAEQARRSIDPQTDLHATADYRRHLAGVLTIRAARQAVSTAEQGTSAA